MDLIRHWLGLYPRQWTKKYHESIFGKPDNTKKLKGLTSDQKVAVSILDEMLMYDYKGADKIPPPY